MTLIYLYLGNDVVDLQIDASKKIILLYIFSNWFIANMLSLRIDKTCYSVFGATDVSIKLKIGDITLKQEECSKYLGVTIDYKRTWQNHIDYIYNKIIKFVGIFFIE